MANHDADMVRRSLRGRRSAGRHRWLFCRLMQLMQAVSIAAKLPEHEANPRPLLSHVRGRETQPRSAWIRVIRKVSEGWRCRAEHATMFQPFNEVTRRCILCRIPRDGRFQQRCEANTRAALVYCFVRFGEVSIAKKKKLVETSVKVSKNRSVIQDEAALAGSSIALSQRERRKGDPQCSLSRQ